MKILFLTPWYPNDISPNAGTFIKSQAEALSRTNEVIVISSKVNYSKFSPCSFTIKRSNYVKVDTHQILINKSFPGFNQLNYLLITLWVTWRIARKFRPDIIHSNIGYPGGIWGWITAEVFKLPFIFSEHTKISNSFRSFFHRKLTLFSVKRAKYCIAVSHALAFEMEAWYKRPVIVIPNIVETDRFKDILPSNNTTPQIGFLGGMNTPVKGLDILLESLAKVKEDFTLHIGGAGLLETEYKMMAAKFGIQNKCRFYGFIPFSDVPAFMSNLHFFVCSSRSETFNVALAEAMACGLPVVSSKCGGPEDFVNKDNGILVDVNNKDALRDGLVWMMQHYTEFNARIIKNFVSDNFSPEKFSARIDKLLHE